MSRIVVSLRVAAPRERVFDLARSVDAHVASATSTSERVVGGRSSGLLELGDEVTWQARHFGVVQRLTSRITAFDRPRSFRDSMVRGAFARFHHDHFFDADGDGVVMRDAFDFRAPLGPLGHLADVLFLRAHMQRFLEARAEILRALAEGSEWQRYLPDASPPLG